MNRKLIFTDPPYSIWREPGVPPAARELLEHTVIGSAGVQYEHRTRDRIIPLLTGPSTIYVTKEEELLAMVVFCRNQIATTGQRFESEYVRYFAAGPGIRGRGIVKKLSAQLMDAVREGEKEKTVFFGVIERGNKASYKVTSSVGYRPIGKIKTVGFSRFFPKKSRRMEKLENEPEKEAMLALLTDYYHDYALVHFDFIFLNEGYFVIRENGVIVAGAQLHLGNWVVRRMPGLLGKILMRAIPHIPVLNCLFNPKDFRFASFEGIYCKEGYEDTLFELFEGLLAKYGLKSAIFWMAENSPLYQRIIARGKLGVLHAFVKDADTQVMASFRNMLPEEEQLFEEHPVYACALDYM